MNFTSKHFFFHSWNLFVMVCSIPRYIRIIFHWLHVNRIIFSIILGCVLLAFPESPKFLYEIGEADKALHILQKIYAVNTKDAPGNFPVKTLKGSEKSASELKLHTDRSVRQLRIRKPKEFALLLKEIWTQIKNLCRKPHLKNTALACFIQFGLTTRWVLHYCSMRKLVVFFQLLHAHVVVPGANAKIWTLWTKP